MKLGGAKNNQYGREELLFLHRSGDLVICPVVTARWIYKAARSYGTSPDEPALLTSRQSGITSKMVSCVIKEAAVSCGLSPEKYSTHSVRIGGATKPLNAGAHRLVIKVLGRWLSNAFGEYPVLTAEGARGISSLMG